MCDYSLGEIRNRLAVEGEELIVHRFPTHSIGLASPADLRPNAGQTPARNQNLWRRIKNFFTPAFDCHDTPAVCIPPGAWLILKSIPPDLQRKWNVGEEESVLFVQTSAEVYVYRDAFCFGNGCLVSLQDVSEGIRVKVMSLSGAAEREPAVEVPTSPPFR